MNAQPSQKPTQVPRPEFEVELIDATAIGDVERPLTITERLMNNEAVQRLTILVVLIVIWEMYARWLNNGLLFPSFSETIKTFSKDIANGVLIDRTFTSLRTLAIGYALGLALAAVFTTFAVASTAGTRVLSTLTAMFNPLPAIALLPLALIWFGLGTPSLVFVIIHSVLWAVALNTLIGFRSVPETLRMSGRNVGLKGARSVGLILIPAAFPSILAGLDRVGFCLAHARGGGTGFRRVRAFGRHRLVYLRSPERSRHRNGFLRASRCNSHRTRRGVRNFSYYRSAHGQSMGHATMIASCRR